MISDDGVGRVVCYAAQINAFTQPHISSLSPTLAPPVLKDPEIFLKTHN